ncbi:hypothetical protein B0I37DRAFT_368303 [Chaetomium sp. MPI-CAGE-AT-0009]|nr:hypothetical protein B0I37DRAFT_368303 [Chaetomium sp. MPI-CAGE-AT-0009]
MRLSSALLSATALLAHTASGFLLAASTPDAMTRVNDYVRLRKGVAGIYMDGLLPPLDIEVSPDGRIMGKSGQVVLRATGDDEWTMVSTRDIPGRPSDITRPFEFDGHLVYKGEGTGLWYLCGPENYIEIVLATNGQIPQGRRCVRASLYRASQ